MESTTEENNRVVDFDCVVSQPALGAIIWLNSINHFCSFSLTHFYPFILSVCKAENTFKD